MERVVAYRVATGAQAELVGRARTQALVVHLRAALVAHVVALVELGHLLGLARLHEAPFVAGLGRLRLTHRS